MGCVTYLEEDEVVNLHARPASLPKICAMFTDSFQVGQAASISFNHFGKYHKVQG